MGISIAQSQTYINSWENSLEGWSVVDTTDWTSAGFSTTTGVMAGSYSWAVQNTTGNYLWDQTGATPDLQGPSSVGLTTLLANGGSVNVNVVIPNSGDFGWGIGFSLYLNQPGGVGLVTVSQWANWMSAGPSSAVLNFAIPSSLRAGLLANPTLPCSLRLATGGGGPGTMYMDGLRVVPLGQLNSWEDSYEGWSVADTADWSFGPLSTTTGVTAGLYSLAVTNKTGNFLWDQTGATPDLQGPSSTDLTALLANATNVMMDVNIPNTGDFGWGIGFSLYLNQPGGAGLVIVDQWNNWMSAGPSSATLTFIIPASVRTALLNNPTLPCSLRLATGGGGPGTMYIDNLRATLLPPAPANLSIRELWDGLSGELIPAHATVTDNSSSSGFASGAPWVVNPAETNNCGLMAFRPGFANDAVAGGNTMGLPTTLDGSSGCMVQENSGFNYVGGGNSFWTAGDFMTRQLNADQFINFQAVGEYWFSYTIANAPTSLYGQYVTFPASGWGGVGFADGIDTNANFVAVGVSGLNVYIGPTNLSAPWGATNLSKTLYISQGTLGQSGNLNSTVYNPLLDLSANPPDQPPDYAPPYNQIYTQTNFTDGPYHINAYETNVNTIGHVSGDYITVLGHLKTHGDGTATLDAKFYGTGIGGALWNTELDMNTNNITWDCSYSFSYGGTMTKMLLFQNGQFPFYMFGLRASANFQDVVGLDRAHIAVAPLANTFEGYAINMTNLAVEANSYSWLTPPAGYGTLNYQWYTNGVAIGGATSQYYNIASASTNNAGTYTCVATDPSGTWAPVTNSVGITVTHLNPPTVTSVGQYHDGETFLVTLDQPNLTGADFTNHYVFSGGIGVANLTFLPSGTATEVQIRTTGVPEGTRITLTISGITNVVGGVLATTNITFWTDLSQAGVANWNCWLCPAQQNNAYWPTWLPANPHPTIVQNMLLSSWEGPTTGVTNVGLDSYVGDDFGANLTGWFIPPVTTNYVFYCYADDGARLSLSTNSSSTNMFVIACESDWSGVDQWTNICNQYGQYGTGPHRGDGNATNWVGANNNNVWDNSFVAQSPATACMQNRSDQFIVAYYDSTGLPSGPAGATNSWAAAESKVEFCIPPGMTNFWPNRDANGQALIHLQAGQKYYMKLEFLQNGGGYAHGVTYKIAGQPDPTSPSVSIMTGANIAGLDTFRPTISIAETPGGPVITYTGVLYSGTTPLNINTQVGISSGGPTQYVPPPNASAMFYRTSL